MVTGSNEANPETSVCDVISYYILHAVEAIILLKEVNMNGR